MKGVADKRQKTVTLTDSERKSIRAIAPTTNQISKALGIGWLTAEELLSGGPGRRSTVERVRARLAALQSGDNA